MICERSFFNRNFIWQIRKPKNYREAEKRRTLTNVRTPIESTTRRDFVASVTTSSAEVKMPLSASILTSQIMLVTFACLAIIEKSILEL